MNRKTRTACCLILGSVQGCYSGDTTIGALVQVAYARRSGRCRPVSMVIAPWEHNNPGGGSGAARPGVMAYGEIRIPAPGLPAITSGVVSRANRMPATGLSGLPPGARVVKLFLPQKRRDAVYPVIDCLNESPSSSAILSFIQPLRVAASAPCQFLVTFSCQRR